MRIGYARVSTRGYARVSTREQNTDGQLDALRAAQCERVYVDKASGKLARRPEWDRCREQLRSGDTLVVTKLDRMGRSLRHLIDVVGELDAQGVELVVLAQGIDTTSPGGRLLFHVLAAMAEFSVISTRRAADVPAVGAAA
jgi:DNA invertase Pin-like site-specific DNA recombinase